MLAPMPPPTAEQTDILDAVASSDGNMMIKALAGTGKTNTLERIEAISPTQILYIAFNRRNVDEAEKKFKASNTVRTINGLGHRVWSHSCGRKLVVNGRKLNDILKNQINDLQKQEQREAWDCYWEVIQAANMARALGYIPDGIYPDVKRLITQAELATWLEEEPTELTWYLVDGLLKQSIRAAYDGLIDFNDQVYMPAMFGGTFPRFPLVMVDEKQDLSPVNIEMLAKLNAGRLISVGDPNQSIYGFRGAARSGMVTSAARFNMQEFDLSISFRCPRAIVENVRWHVPHFKWFNDGGAVHHLAGLTADSIPNDAAIICRNNAPLFRMAFILLSAGRSVKVAGSDIGPKLIGVMRKLGDREMPREKVLDAIEAWLNERLRRGSTTAQDMADAMVIFAHRGDTLYQACSWAEYILKQEGSIQLLTGHKSKGLEFDTVFHLDPHLIKMDKGDQELNLRYVIDTRAKQTLYYFNSESIAP